MRHYVATLPVDSLAETLLFRAAPATPRKSSPASQQFSHLGEMHSGRAFAGWLVCHFMEVNDLGEAGIEVFHKRTRIAGNRATVFESIRAMRNGQAALCACDSNVKEPAFFVEVTFEL
jgi:hypothetical protein